MRRLMIATFCGQVSEWYDYGVYALVAAQIGTHFFPSAHGDQSLLAALAVFGVAFLARPLGGGVMGVLGDRMGRKAVLVISLALMTMSTAAIGCLPGSEVLGMLAPLLLVGARFVQGISAAGESTAAITFVAESAPAHSKGLFTATLMSGNSAGFLLATACVWLTREILGDAAFDAWGWRCVFLFALPLGCVGLFIRKGLKESAAFTRLHGERTLSTTPLRDTFTSGMIELLQAIGISALSFIANYLLVAYLPIHLAAQGFSPRAISSIGVAATLTLMLSYPLMGALSDRVGRRPMMLSACAFFIILGWPLFTMINGASSASAFLCAISYAVATAAFISCLGLYCTEYIDKSRLMTTYSLGFNLSAAIFGGSSLWVFGMLSRLSGNPATPAIYLGATAMLTMISILSVRKRQQ